MLVRAVSCSCGGGCGGGVTVMVTVLLPRARLQCLPQRTQSRPQVTYLRGG
jgi:hypothetical protein